MPVKSVNERPYTFNFTGVGDAVHRPQPIKALAFRIHFRSILRGHRKEQHSRGTENGLPHRQATKQYRP